MELIPPKKKFKEWASKEPNMVCVQMEIRWKPRQRVLVELKVAYPKLCPTYTFLSICIVLSTTSHKISRHRPNAYTLFIQCKRSILKWSINLDPHQYSLYSPVSVSILVFFRSQQSSPLNYASTFKVFLGLSKFFPWDNSNNL